MTFKELNLSAPLLRAVQEAGYETPSPIQAAAIPPVLAGRDLMGCAQTGTGKTAAFALPMLDRLTANAPRRKGAVRALILTPTRELALQIGESFEAYGKYLKLRSTVICGGVGQAPQVEALKKVVDILIACPGRLNDLIGQGFIDLSALEIFVLDEADRASRAPVTLGPAFGGFFLLEEGLKPGQRIVVHDFVRLDIEAPIARTGPQPHIGLLGIYHPAAVVGLRIPHGTDDSHIGFPVEDIQQFVRPVAAVARDDDEFVHHGQYRPHALHHQKVVGHRILDKRKSANLHIVSLSFRPSGSGHENRRPPLSSPAGQR